MNPLRLTPAELFSLGVDMNFALRYQGPLPTSAGKNVEAKNKLRRDLHVQLETLCKIEAPFSKALPDNLPIGVLKGRRVLVDKSQPYDGWFFRVQIAGRDYVPLVSRFHHLVCNVDVNLWRREDPGATSGEGGDLDNRVKTLFDALRMPHYSNEVRGRGLEGLTRCYCLVEDDALITNFSVSTHRMLYPVTKSESLTDVHMDIYVHVRAAKPLIGNWGFPYVGSG